MVLRKSAGFLYRGDGKSSDEIQQIRQMMDALVRQMIADQFWSASVHRERRSRSQQLLD